MNFHILFDYYWLRWSICFIRYDNTEIAVIEFRQHETRAASGDIFAAAPRAAFSSCHINSVLAAKQSLAEENASCFAVSHWLLHAEVTSLFDASYATSRRSFFFFFPLMWKCEYRHCWHTLASFISFSAWCRQSQHMAQAPSASSWRRCQRGLTDGEGLHSARRFHVNSLHAIDFTYFD